MINDRIEQILEKIENPILRNASHYALFSGGKRIRPNMLLSISGEAGLDVAVAIELIHTYTLIHDDLPSMDNDDYRRGKPTLHKAFDEATAILTGDLLLTLAFDVISSSSLRDAVKIQIIQRVAKKTGANGLIEGQLLDIASKTKNIDWNEHEHISLRKTSDLFSASLVSGALIKELQEEQVSIYEEFGQTFGLLYQLKDDCDDENSPIPQDTLTKTKELLGSHAAHLLTRLSSKNLFLEECLNALSALPL